MKNGNPAFDLNLPGKAHCPECGAGWPDGRTCRDYFHDFLFWEHENLALGAVHHLMVLCYHLQHPSLYSREGLHGGIELLDRFVRHGQSPQQVRRTIRKRANSGSRTRPITARTGNEGSYAREVCWDMTTVDILVGGKDCYRENVVAWADSIYRNIDLVGEATPRDDGSIIL